MSRHFWGWIALLLVSSSCVHFSAQAEDLDEDHLDTPPYYRVSPSIAFSIKAGFNKFPIATSNGPTYQFQFDYYLPWQKAGTFFIGAHAGVIPLNVTALSSSYGNLIGGAQVGYLLKFWKSQPVIPFASFKYDYLRLLDGNGTSFTTSDTGYSFGLMISLNPFDSFTVRDAYVALGLTAGYILAEYQPITLVVPSSGSSVNGNIVLWGIKLEFE